MHDHARAGVPSQNSVIVSGHGNFRVAPGLADHWDGQGDDSATMDADVEPFILEESMPDGVLFNEVLSPIQVDGSRKTKLVLTYRRTSGVMATSREGPRRGDELPSHHARSTPVNIACDAEPLADATCRKTQLRSRRADVQGRIEGQRHLRLRDPGVPWNAMVAGIT